jgi:hypothetical protein
VPEAVRARRRRWAPTSPQSARGTLYDSLLCERIDEHTQDLLVAFNVQELLLFELPVRALHREAAPLDPLRVRRGGCPVVDDGTDTDGDGVPDDATFTFDGGACTVFVDPVGTFTQSGSVAIVDIGTEPGYQLVWEDYRVELAAAGTGDISAVTMTGTWDVTATSTTATLQEALEMTFDEQVGSEATTETFTLDWTAHFESDGDPLDLSLPLPSGSLVVQGPMTWSLDELSFSFDASTTQHIAFDADCTSGLELVAGAVHALQQNGMGTFLDVRYTGCGLEPAITYVPAY